MTKIVGYAFGQPTLRSGLTVESKSCSFWSMTFGKTRFINLFFGATLLAALGASARTEDCREPKTGTKEVPIFSPPLANVVIGTGRLQFYSAPNLRCPIDGIFVIPRDKLVAYAEASDGWSSVMYMNPKTGNIVSGWVRSARLKQTGTMGPKR